MQNMEYKILEKYLYIYGRKFVQIHFNCLLGTELKLATELESQLSCWCRILLYFISLSSTYLSMLLFFYWNLFCRLFDFFLHN